jgi:acetyl esterase/lipase
MLKRLSPGVIVVLALALPAAAQPSGDLQSAVALFQKVRTAANVTYVHANGWEGKLDVYAQRTPQNGPAMPVVIVIHGGGWVQGTKEASILQGVLPYVAMGYSVVNVEYRLANVSLAPAAIEDCRCALRWVVAHAKEYNFDVDRIVAAGASAGGHLALTTGMIPASAGFDRSCLVPRAGRAEGGGDRRLLRHHRHRRPARRPEQEAVPGELAVHGPVARQPAEPRRPREGIVAAHLHPRRRAADDLIHGDADPLVPYAHSVRLQDALQKAGVVHELVTVPGGGHGNFVPDQWQRSFAAIEKFLAANLRASKPPSTAAR